MKYLKYMKNLSSLYQVETIHSEKIYEVITDVMLRLTKYVVNVMMVLL